MKSRSPTLTLLVGGKFTYRTFRACATMLIAPLLIPHPGPAHADLPIGWKTALLGRRTTGGRTYDSSGSSLTVTGLGGRWGITNAAPLSTSRSPGTST